MIDKIKNNDQNKYKYKKMLQSLQKNHSTKARLKLSFQENKIK
jgi:hypothetical protein